MPSVTPVSNGNKQTTNDDDKTKVASHQSHHRPNHSKASRHPNEQTQHTPQPPQTAATQPPSSTKNKNDQQKDTNSPVPPTAPKGKAKSWS
jgi:hypothetical protein